MALTVTRPFINSPIPGIVLNSMPLSFREFTMVLICCAVAEGIAIRASSAAALFAI
jgi:hypothetical protein